jgi:DNA-directed RNA polymerase specialized sigma24 family protein
MSPGTLNWLEERYPALLAHARARYGVLADDLVQETCVRLLKFERPNFSLAQTIMRNLWVDQRKAKVSQTLSLDAPIGDGEDAETFADRAYGAPDPPAPLERMSELQALRQKIYRVMKQLGPEHRQVLELAVLGYKRHPGTTTRAEFSAQGSHDLYAAAAACPQGTAKSRLNRAKAAFARAWERKPGRPFRVGAR